ncbi:MAG TPA: DUF3261 domain-containing protein [Gammaproteobacteria bacterium]
MRRARLAAWALLALPLAGCITPLMPDCTRFGRSGQVCPLPPAALPAMDGSRLVTVTREGRQDSFMGQLHIDAGGLRLAGSSLFGTGLFLMQYDGRTLSVEPDAPELPTDKLLVMLELALADPAELKPRLHDLTLTVTDTDQGERREIAEHGHMIALIEKDAAPLDRQSMRIEVPPLGLTVDMKPLEAGP